MRLKNVLRRGWIAMALATSAAPALANGPSISAPKIVSSCSSAQGLAAADWGYFTVDTNGNLCTIGGGAGSGGSVTAAGTSGTVAQAVQGITGGVALPVSAASLPLPTGAATSAAQTAVQAAPGSSAASAEGIQGVNGGVLVGVAVPDARATGGSINAATLNATYSVALYNGEVTVGFNVTGLTASGATLAVEASSDGGTTWLPSNAAYPATGTLSTTVTADGAFKVNGGGNTAVRLRVSVVGTGTITAAYSASSVGSVASLSALAQTAETGSPDASVAIVPGVAGSAASNVVLKASAGNFYSAYATCSAACWLMVFNATAAPADGATTAGVASGNLQDCIPIASGGTGSINRGSGPPERFTVGIVAVISSTACATKTAATTGFINGSAR